MGTSWTWATVTQASPLRVQLDGDSSPLLASPDTLVHATDLAVGDRVRCELTNRRLIVHGRSAGGSITPAGAITMFAGATPPSGWLLCDGMLISRATYAELFAVIGTSYGAGDGSTTFALPNMKGRVPVGVDSGQAEFAGLGSSGGEKTHVLSAAEIPPHQHEVIGGYVKPGNTGGGQSSPVPQGSYYGFYYVLPQSFTAANTGGGGAHNNLQPFLAINYLIHH